MEDENHSRSSCIGNEEQRSQPNKQQRPPRSNIEANPGKVRAGIFKSLRKSIQTYHLLGTKHSCRRQMMVVYTDERGMVRTLGSEMLRLACKKSAFDQEIYKLAWNDKQLVNSDNLDESMRSILPVPGKRLCEMNTADLQKFLTVLLSSINPGKKQKYKNEDKPSYWPIDVDYVNPKLRSDFPTTDATKCKTLSDVLLYIIRHVYAKMECYDLLNEGEVPDGLFEYVTPGGGLMPTSARFRDRARDGDGGTNICRPSVAENGDSLSIGAGDVLRVVQISDAGIEAEVNHRRVLIPLARIQVMNEEREIENSDYGSGIAAQRSTTVPNSAAFGGLVILKNRFAKLGYMLRDVRGDGNCLFRALDDQMRGRSDGDEHDRLRQESVQYVMDHRNDFEGFEELDESFNTFVRQLSEPGTYAGHVAMTAFSRIYELEVIIYEGDFQPVHINGGLKDCRQLHVAYDSDGQHYYSIRHVGDLSEAPANVNLPFREDGTINESEIGAIPDADFEDEVAAMAIEADSRRGMFRGGRGGFGDLGGFRGGRGGSEICPSPNEVDGITVVRSDGPDEHGENGGCRSCSDLGVGSALEKLADSVAPIEKIQGETTCESDVGTFPIVQNSIVVAIENTRNVRFVSPVQQQSRQSRLRKQKEYPDYVPTEKKGSKRQKASMEDGERVWCSCKKVSDDDMVGCSNKNCNTEWYHFGCVNLTKKPKGKWYCPDCRGDRPNVMKL